MLTKKRAIWRKQHNLCQDKRQVSGAGNMQLILIPVVNKQKLQHGESTETPIRTEEKNTQSTSVKQQKPRGNSISDKSKNKSNGSNTSFRTDLHSWQRDLTEEGIEPHPGPDRTDIHTTHPNKLNSKCKKQLHNTHSFRVWQCNIRSFHKRRDILDMATREKIDIILLQETYLTDFQAAQLHKQSKHWQIFHCESQKDPGKIPGGVAVIVRNGIPAVKSASHSTQYGEWITIALPWQFITSVYKRPGNTKEIHRQFNNELAERLATLGSTTWVVGGDFKEEPLDQWPLLARRLGAQVFYPHDTSQTAASILDTNTDHPEPIPTRWNGHRCLDWTIQRNQHSWPTASNIKWADHKMLTYDIQNPTALPSIRRFKPLPKFTKPEHLDIEVWRALVKKHWENIPNRHGPQNNPHSDLDTAWNPKNPRSQRFQLLTEEAAS